MKHLVRLSILFTLLANAMSAQAEPAYRHVVLFRFKDDAPAAKVVEIEKAFMALKGKISLIQEVEWGLNVSPEGLNDGYTHCFLVTFKQKADLERYLPHPAHRAFVDILKPQLDKVLVVDYLAQKK
ncbi:MAG: Dabb family protein [Verrucomicrobiota bacterium]